MKKLTKELIKHVCYEIGKVTLLLVLFAGIFVCYYICKHSNNMVEHVLADVGIGVFIWRFIVYANWYFQDLADRQDQ